MPIFVLMPKVLFFLLSLSQSDGGLELLLDLDGSHSGWVEARTHCNHLPAAVSPSEAECVPPPASPCTSRFVNQHMLKHFEETGHYVALRYSDPSVWCFKCDAYLDVQAILPLQLAYEIVHLLKFVVSPPFWAMKSSQMQ